MLMIIPFAIVNRFYAMVSPNCLVCYSTTCIHNVYVHSMKAKGKAWDDRPLEIIIKLTLTYDVRPCT